MGWNESVWCHNIVGAGGGELGDEEIPPPKIVEFWAQWDETSLFDVTTLSGRGGGELGDEEMNPKQVQK